MAFVFYDTETTGLDKSFDQILQFAAIRTDADLNELDRFEIRCRLHGHMAPSPGAMRITGVTVAQLTDPASPSHYEMMRAIEEKLLSWSPSIFVGYNSIRFDEPLLRQALYQTLHNPYLTTSMNGNCRADAMGLMQSVAQLFPDAFVVPIGDNGKPSFKLDRLAPANGFDHSNAHEALADVEATIKMCRLVSEQCPDAWSTFTRFAQKAAVVDYVSSEPAFAFIAYYNKHCAYALTLLQFDEKQSSTAYAFDLAYDLPTLADLNDTKLAAKLKKSPQPIRRLKANEAPCLRDLDELPDHVRSDLPSTEIIEAQLAWLQVHPEFVERMMTIYKSIRDDYDEPIHVEQKIYAGFPSDQDRPRLEAFHAAPWEERFAIVMTIEDERYKELGLRVLHAERPDLLPPEVKTTLDAEIGERLLGSELGGEPWLTLPKALIMTNDLLANATGDEHILLTDLATYLTERIDQLSVC